MNTMPKLTFVTFALLISFASVNAVLFTPALPDIALYFGVEDEVANYTISWFLIGYTLTQLFCGPFVSRFGRKATLYIGISVQILASMGCVFAGMLKLYPLLILSRFFLALGSGVGLKMTFTLINEWYEPKVASQKIAYLALAFAITPGLGVALGGLCHHYFGWMSCFVLSAGYGMLLLAFVYALPITKSALNLQAFRWTYLQKTLLPAFKQKTVLAGGLLMGCSTCFIYVFAALAPFIAIDKMSLQSQEYGLMNIIPAFGLIAGSLLSTKLVQRYSLFAVIKVGIICSLFGVVLMIGAISAAFSALFALFLPMVLVQLGIALILPNASSLAMSFVEDKVHASAVMNFVNMGLSTLVVLALSHIPLQAILLPGIFLILCLCMLVLQYCLKTQVRMCEIKAI